ncbi:hypothetical protein FPZ12_036765 [Amycolatopsis acidicola]|uniref:DUF5666 domain-containing protein n=1 Tax=Amycolatopsis acidicola TaxID=2596893 RepID=A0A5N0USE6_9PSEU|nr:hypothetical protein [Amycolatopsis acidicola]KAA9152475.1 hypothetical protein FPZ12_036765 [Amycolatopsis acidicola]
MSTEPTTTPEAKAEPESAPAWGDPQPPAPKWSGKKTAIAAAVAIVIVAVGGVAIYLGTSSADSEQQGGMGGFPGGGRMGGMGGQMSGLTSLASALHGDFTVSENGSYITERLQTGEVSALSADSITVKSKDNYTQTYKLDSSTQKASNLANGSSVTVLAKVSGDTATATSVTDSSQSQQGGGQNGSQQGGQGGFPGGSQGGMPGGGQGGFPAGGQMPGQPGSNN